MCNAFSCLVTKNKKVIWKFAMDSHSDLIMYGNLKDSDDCIKFVRVEIKPENNSYLKPDRWVFKIDSKSVPDWFSPAHKESCMVAFGEWRKHLYKILVRKDVVDPFKLKLVRKVSLKQKLLLKSWASVRGSVGGSVRGSVGGSVWGSVGGSVGGLFGVQ